DSLFFNYLNANKLGVELEWDDRRIAALASHADIVIQDLRGDDADELDATLSAANPVAVVLSLTPYGRSGPRADWSASALTEWATGGYHYFGGDPAREPIALPGYQAEFHAGLHGAVAALAGLWHARNTGEGQRIELSHQEAVLTNHAWLTTSWTHMGQVQRRTGSLYAKCADGFVYLFNLAPYPNLFVLMERFDLLEDEALQDPQTWVMRFDEVFAAFSQWAATRSKQEVFHACQELRIAASPVNTMEDVANSEQLAARDWFGTVEANGRSFIAPGFPYKLMGTPCESRIPAPTLGQHTAEVLSPTFSWANDGVTRPATQSSSLSPQSSRSGPLSGIRLIEVTANWAGPAGGRDFADLGAEVIKIELATKPATRALIYAGGDVAWPQFYNRAGYFNKLNRNKKAISLDLSKPRGREVFLQLVAKADAVLENNAARVMAQLHLAYDDMAAANPGIIMCSMSGFGNTGPERNYSAYGSNIETISGLASLLGYRAGEFYGTGSFYADPTTGHHGAVALLAALHARRRTGRGQWIDMALLEAVAPFFGQQFLEYSATGVSPTPLGNGHPSYSPQGVYPTAGADCWIALSVRNQREWIGLANRIGRPDMADDTTFDSAEGRRSAAAQIDDAIRDWCATRDHNEAADLLQSVGVPAAPVMANWELFSDNHLNDRGFFVPMRHEKAGTFAFPGFPWRFERTPAAMQCPAPMFAEHNDDVFRRLLGLSPAEIHELYETGITTDGPRYAGGPSL
ncbi:MAG TPA: CoA transferase, partial [Tepidiformaceae bacterium]|nr:CoA transferase [Tepidiformaceae bacterium]